MGIIYYGRKKEGSGKILRQPLLEHSQNTAERSAQFVGVFSDATIGRWMGMHHDIGKYDPDFQKRLEDESLLVPHAYAGALECEALYQAKNRNRNFLYRLIGMAISGHHSGLKDYGSGSDGYCGQMKAYSRTAYAAWQTETPQLAEPDTRAWNERIVWLQPRADIGNQRLRECIGRQLMGFTFQMFGRFLFSSLVDADRIDAQNFPEQDADRYMEGCEKLLALKARLDAHLAQLKEEAKPTPLNVIRNGIQRDCLTAARQQRGFFSLSVPTGGGKTLSSMAFALSHALEHKQERIIYAIPFTSIIEQNAKVFADIFGRKNVLEHHSNFELPFVEDDDKEECSRNEALERRKLAEENWYEPIVVTTNVQFFESLFASKPGRARKVHNIANSVIILDEAQAIPIEFLRPCMAALAELVANYGCTVVFCTATQSELDRNALFLTEVDIREIIADVPRLFAALRRTEETYLGAQSLAQIAARLQAERQALCIVNTKRHARDLARALAETGAQDVYHLSTNLYPEHRKAVLKEIRDRLGAKLPCLVISTQLIEAGVDIDFPAVYRAAAGVDSIVQAAGRCNREGRSEPGRVYVFVPEEKYRGKGYLERTAQLGGLTMEKYPRFLDSEAVRAYFKALFNLEREQADEKKILLLCGGIVGQNQKDMQDLHIPYATIGKEFKLIEDDTYALVIPTPKAQGLLARAAFAPRLGGILRDLAQYTVNVRKHELQWLAEQGALNKVAESIAVLADEKLYDKAYGLVLESNDEFDDYIV